MDHPPFSIGESSVNRHKSAIKWTIIVHSNVNQPEEKFGCGTILEAQSRKATDAVNFANGIDYHFFSYDYDSDMFWC
jgi:hypothetical protein